MLSRQVLVCNQKGLHARAAAKLVKLAGSYEAEVFVSRYFDPAQGELMESDDAVVSARSILGLMMLGAHKGVVLQLRTETQGGDAKAALDAIAALIEARFEEDA